MQSIKIGLVEDEMVIAASIVSTLTKLNYTVATPASHFTQAVEMIENEQPDLLLLDINLGGQKDGIDIAEYVRAHHQIPIIFLTANSDTATVQRAKMVKPNAYLLKPFNKDDLYTAIEIAIHNFDDNRDKVAPKEQFIVKCGQDYQSIKINEIVFVESNDNYVSIQLVSGKPLLVRSTLSEMQDRLPASSFLRVNRSVIINTVFVNKIETDVLFIQDYSFDINSKVKKELLEMLG